MNEQEGVIKYDLIHSNKPIADNTVITDINAWRSVIHRLGLIGQDPGRYGGFGFGNISLKVIADSGVFIISGTQTGHIAQLSADHYCVIEQADFIHNTIRSSGTVKPSSEALTHACVYQQTPQVQAVIHVHSPEIWRNTLKLDLPCTGTEIAYGTLAMVHAVETLFTSGALKSAGIFSMLGHEDGIVSFGPTLEQAAWQLIKQLALAIRIEQHEN